MIMLNSNKNLRIDMRRHEEKYFLDYKEMSDFLSMFNAYPQHAIRTVNSIYFDTRELKFFHEGEEGIVPRMKCRYRWYGNKDVIGTSGAIEIKKTLSHFREKETYDHNYNGLDDISNLFLKKTNELIMPKCHICYDRVYYTNINGLRFTYDFNIQYRSIKNNSFNRLGANIFEIKYQSEVKRDTYANILGNTQTRFSKYAESILKINL